LELAESGSPGGNGRREGWVIDLFKFISAGGTLRLLDDRSLVDMVWGKTNVIFYNTYPMR
jgi:hypothetical protein